MKLSTLLWPGLACVAACVGLANPVMAQSLADCNAATVDGDTGPIKKALYVVGTFPGASWLHVPARKMSYKGNGIYQLVNDEKAGPVTFQYATLNWNPQFSAKSMAMTPGVEADMTKGAMGTDTAITLPTDGKYVWSIHVESAQKATKAMVAACK